MDYLEGTSIDKAKMSLPEMLEAFAKVCHAVDHAHEQKIIHRDIKPANISTALRGSLSTRPAASLQAATALPYASLWALETVTSSWRQTRATSEAIIR